MNWLAPRALIVSVVAPDALAACVRVKVVVVDTCTRVPGAMPTPVTTQPARSPGSVTPVTAVLPLVVVAAVTASPVPIVYRCQVWPPGFETSFRPGAQVQTSFARPASPAMIVERLCHTCADVAPP